jgi:hypothetical protein
MKTYTELGLTFDESLLDKLVGLMQQGFEREALFEQMGVPKKLYYAVFQAYLGGSED